MRVDEIRELTGKYPWLEALNLDMRLIAIEDIAELNKGIEGLKEIIKLHKQVMYYMVFDTSLNEDRYNQYWELKKKLKIEEEK